MNRVLEKTEGSNFALLYSDTLVKPSPPTALKVLPKSKAVFFKEIDRRKSPTKAALARLGREEIGYHQRAGTLGRGSADTAAAAWWRSAPSGLLRQCQPVRRLPDGTSNGRDKKIRPRE